MEKPVRTIVHLGSGPEGQTRKAALEEMAEKHGAISQRKEPSIGVLLRMIADGDILLDPAPAVPGKGNEMDNRFDWSGAGWYASFEAQKGIIVTEMVPDTDLLFKADGHRASQTAREWGYGTPRYYAEVPEWANEMPRYRLA